MRVLIVGAGLAGVTTAHYLRAQGADVTVLERAAGPALETSFANGALLHPSLVDPWNSPGILGYMVRNLGREDSPMLLRLKALPQLIGWGWRFIAASSPERFRANTLRNLALARYSMQVLARLRDSTPLDYGSYARGSLQVFRAEREWTVALDWARSLECAGLRHRALAPAELIAVEPALAPIAGQLVGGIHFPDDEGGDAHRFVVALAAAAAERGVAVRYGTEVARIAMHGQVARGVLLRDGTLIEADAVLVAAASYSAALARTAGISVPVRPAKGYSITVPVAGQAGLAPRVPVLDHDLHMGVVPLGTGHLRVVGTAEFAGYDLSVPAGRVANLLALLQRLYPRLASGLHDSAVSAWAGLRPMSPDGVPIIGATGCRGLFLNTGHGQLGWTMAAGSGKLAAAVVGGLAPEIDAAPYALARFAPR